MEENTQCYCRVVPLRKIIPEGCSHHIEQLVQQTSEIVRETYQFWKAFCLFRLEHGMSSISFDRQTAKLVFGVIAFPKPRKDKSEENKKKPLRDKKIRPDELDRLRNSSRVRDQIKQFYIDHYKPIQLVKYPSPGSDILDVEIIQIQTAIETHIKVHFYSYVKRLAFSTIPKPDKKDKNAKLIRSQRTRLLKDLYENTYKSTEQYHGLIDRFGAEIQTAKNRRYSDPQGCLHLLYEINQELEIMGERTFALFPLRKSIIPSSFSLSKTICNQFETPGMWDKICGLIKKLNIEPKQGFGISSIRTAGSSASIIFTTGRKLGRPRNEFTERYIDDLTPEELINLGEKKIVAADPNKGNLLQMMDDEGIRLRYTAQQKKFETHSGRYRKIRLEREKFAFSLDESEEEPVALKDALIYMKQFNSRTTDFRSFMEYVKEKNLFASRFRGFYLDMWHRKFAYNIKMNTNRSRDRFLNLFQETYGSPDTTVLCVGDWEQKPGISFGKAPTMGIGIRSWFRKRGYAVYLVDECRTSLTCCKCKDENEYNWKTRLDPRPWKEGKIQRVWGLSRCTNSQCRSIHNRDVCSSENIQEICQSHIWLNKHPKYFKRNHNCVGTAALRGNGDLQPSLGLSLTVDGHCAPIPRTRV